MTSEAPSDAELLAAHVAGDPEAFAEIVRRHRDRLWAVAVRTLADRDEAADAVQEALLAAYRRAETFRGEAAVTTWLHRIVVNACLDRLRRRAARPTSPLDDRALDVLADRADEPGRVELRIDVERALATLPDGQRTALVLVDMQGLPVAQVAVILGVAEGTVKSRCARGRAALAPLLLEPSRVRPATGNPAPPGDVPSPSATPGTTPERPAGGPPARTTVDDPEGGGPR